MYGDSVGLQGQEQVGEYIVSLANNCYHHTHSAQHAKSKSESTYGVSTQYVYMVYLCTYGDSVGLQVYTWYIYCRYIKYIIYYYIISVGW
jgi:hypothetical protein